MLYSIGISQARFSRLNRRKVDEGGKAASQKQQYSVKLKDILKAPSTGTLPSFFFLVRLEQRQYKNDSG